MFDKLFSCKWLPTRIYKKMIQRDYLLHVEKVRKIARVLLDYGHLGCKKRGPFRLKPSILVTNAVETIVLDP